jgi:hypothetical protein
MGSCKEVNKPGVEEEALECSEIISTNCVQSIKAENFLQIGVGDTLTTIITKIKNAIKTLSNKTVDFTNIPVYADEAAAVVGGLATGKVYKTSTGELRIKL